jgi:hypothetical protein
MKYDREKFKLSDTKHEASAYSSVPEPSVAETKPSDPKRKQVVRRKALYGMIVALIVSQHYYTCHKRLVENNKGMESYALLALSSASMIF